MEFNVKPYYDDFESNAKENNYVRLLFKPGYAVQARELTQIQSAIQNQIKALGDHIFKDGSPVIGGTISLDNKVTFLKLEETYNNQDIEIDDLVDKVIIRSSDGLVQAKTLVGYYPSGGTPTLLVKYLSGVEFEDGDVFKIAGTSIEAKLVGSNSTGKASAASINDGIFYVDGFFVQVAKQNIVIDPYGQNANVKLGLEISDDVIDYLVDSTLLDPAQGSFNYQAPGADRYQFSLNLSTRPLASSVDESKFFELMRIENGFITKQVKYPIYAELEKTLARRTYDESGDYLVTPFKVLTSNVADQTKYGLEIDPGKAYVKGFEFETVGKLKITGDKPRSDLDKRAMIGVDIATTYGNSIRITSLFGASNNGNMFDIKQVPKVDIHCVRPEKVNIGLVGGSSANSIQYNSTKIGTMAIRNIARYLRNTKAELLVDSNGVFDLYVTDIDVKPKIFTIPTQASNTTSIVLPNTASVVDNAYSNMTLSVLPISLTRIANANTRIFASIVTKGPTTTNLRTAGLRPGDTVRIGDDVRTVTVALPNRIRVDRPMTSTFTSGGALGDIYIEKQTSNTSNVTGQVRKIVRYDGATRTAFLEKAFDNEARAGVNTVVQLNCGFKDTESLVQNPSFSSVTSATFGASAGVYIPFQFGSGETPIAEAKYKSLIFRLPRQHVSNTNFTNVNYVTNKYLTVSGTGNTFIVGPGAGLNSGEEAIEWPATINNIEDNLICFVKDKGTSSFANGQILNLGSTGTFTAGSVAVDSGTGTMTITISSGTGTIAQLGVYVNVSVKNAHLRLRRKSLISNTQYQLESYNYPTAPTGITYTVSVPNANATLTGPITAAQINATDGLIFIQDELTNIAPGEKISLFVPDVSRIRRILKGTAAAWPTSATYTDITDNFSFDSGQRDELYDHGTITLKSGYSTPNAKIIVHCDFFDHTYDSNGTFFCVNSYGAGLYENGTIPVYVSSKYGIFPLRDCLDFRPTKKIGEYDRVIDSGTLSDSNYSVELSFEYWLARIDKLILTKTKEFKILKGVSAVSPVAPDDDSDSMTLYVIYLPPYVHDMREVSLKYVENKRYTMKDISKIDKRLERVEYYTSLNNIENRALSDPALFLDEITKKEKYGLVGEDFRNFNIADYKNRDFSVSKTKRGITAKSKTRIFDLQPYSYNNVKKNRKTISLNYTETPAISQPLVSNDYFSVQPFLFASFIGNITLSPELDYWVSEELKPEIIKAPEVTTVIKEVTSKEIIRETITEREIYIYVGTPNANANTQQADVGQDIEPSPSDDIGININIPTNINTDRETEANTNSTGTDIYGIDEDAINGLILPALTFDIGSGLATSWQPADYLGYSTSVPDVGQLTYTDSLLATSTGTITGDTGSGTGGGGGGKFDEGLGVNK